MKKTQTKKWKSIADLSGGISLKQDNKQSTLFSARWRDLTGRYVRRRYRASSVEDAIEKAPEIAGLVAPVVREAKNAITIDQAFQFALRQAHRCSTAKLDWCKAQKRFYEWLVKHYPRVEYWSDLSRQILREYLESYSAKSANTQRLYLQPIRQTAGFMAREHSFPNIAERLGLGTKLKKPTPAVYLLDVMDFLDWLMQPKSDKPDSAQNNPDMELGVALQALAGLRVSEALRLTWDKVDLKRGLLEISGEVKNESSKRVIPLCSRVQDALRRAKETQKAAPVRRVQPIHDYVVRDHKGQPITEHQVYGRRFKRTISRWNKEIGWAPKDLRNCLLTWAELQGIRSSLWEQYVGHAAASVTERHYLPRLAAVSAGQEEELQRRMDFFRKHVITPLEQGIGEAQAKLDEQKSRKLQHIATCDISG